MNFRLAQIELTNHCNKSCTFCFRQRMTRPQGYMNRRTFKDSLALCKELKVKEIWLHNWGEPLLHQNLCEFIAMSYKFIVGFVTNGDLLNDKIMNKLAKSGFEFMYISVNASMGRYELFRILVKYEHMNDKGVDCRLRAVVGNKADYHYLSGILGAYKVRWQREMIRDENRIRTKKCQTKNKVFVILWDGTRVPCCHVVNKEDATEEYCRHCFESDADIGVRYKL